MSGDVSLHGLTIGENATGTVGWQGKLNPMDLLARAHWNSIDIDLAGQEGSLYFEEKFLPWMRNHWETSIKGMYLADVHEDAINYIEKHFEALATVAFHDSLSLMFDQVSRIGESTEKNESILQKKDDKWRQSQRVTSETVKRLRSTKNLLAEYQGNHLIYPHMVRITNQITEMTKRLNSYAENVDALVARMGSGWH